MLPGKDLLPHYHWGTQSLCRPPWQGLSLHSGPGFLKNEPLFKILKLNLAFLTTCNCSKEKNGGEAQLHHVGFFYASFVFCSRLWATGTTLDYLSAWTLAAPVLSLSDTYWISSSLLSQDNMPLPRYQIYWDLDPKTSPVLILPDIYLQQQIHSNLYSHVVQNHKNSRRAYFLFWTRVTFAFALVAVVPAPWKLNVKSSLFDCKQTYWLNSPRMLNAKFSQR